MNKPPDKNKFSDLFKCVKIPIKSVLKHTDINLPKIHNTVSRANDIVIHTLNFIKLYTIYQFEQNNELPTINKEFVNSVMKIMCNEKSKGRPPKQEIKELKEKLTKFKNSFYPLNPELDYTHMNTILDYLTIDIITMYENNIKQRYIGYIERFVNVVWKKKFLLNKIKKLNITYKEKQTRKNRLCNELRKIKTDLLSLDNNFKSKSFYHNWIKQQKRFILPNKSEFKKESVYYDLQCHPQDYLKCMIFMMKEIENQGEKLNCVFPLRNDIIPKHIRLDTTTLVHLLLTKKYGKKKDFLFKGDLKRNENKIWKFFFRTERSCFIKCNYSFHHMIETDGVSCSILLIRNDKIGKRVRIPKIGFEEIYINEIETGKKIVAYDPGKSDLLYCIDENDKTFRYSQDQRRKETKMKKYNKLILQFKQEKIKGRSVFEYEDTLSKYNRKTLDMEKFKDYIVVKNEINEKLKIFYNRYIFRKLKLNIYLNTKRSEQRMINNFKKIYGSPEKVVIAAGDYEQKRHMKYKEPIKGKGMRTIFRRNGYNVYLVDEYKTSKMCNKCEEGETYKFMERENPKPYRNNRRLVWGLLKCKTCCGVWNRDYNGAKNILKIANCKIRPEYLCRN